MADHLSSFEFLTLKYKGEKINGLRSGANVLSNNLALHVHGTWGNFYENPFATSVGRTYNKLGFN